MSDSSVLCPDSPPLLPTVPPPPIPQRHNDLGAGELESSVATTAWQCDGSARPGARPRRICIYGEPRRGICNGCTEAEACVRVACCCYSTTRQRRSTTRGCCSTARRRCSSWYGGLSCPSARLRGRSAVPVPRRRHGDTVRHDTTKLPCRIVSCLAVPVPVSCRAAWLANYTSDARGSN